MCDHQYAYVLCHKLMYIDGLHSLSTTFEVLTNVSFDIFVTGTTTYIWWFFDKFVYNFN